MTSSNTVSFTPGPWKVHCSHIYAPDGAIIAVVHNPGSKASDYPLVANRDLMAAAPALYEALERVSAHFANLAETTWGLDAGEAELQDCADAALAKVRGDQ